MNHFVGKFVFHPVGHGLFYTGEITDDQGKTFSFAFDCGSENNKIISDIISNGKLPNGIDDILPEQIDLLIISHFHSDHISNALDLISTKKVKKVILPYLNDTTKILYASQIDSTLPDSSNLTLTQFIADPIPVIKGLNENCEVIILNEDRESDFTQPEFSDSENAPFEFKWTDRSSSSNQHAGNASLISPIWEFRFFMPKTGNSTKLQQLKDFFTSKSITIDNAASNYSAIETEMKRLGLANNASNIVCAHGPVRGLFITAIHCNRTCSPFFIPSYYLWRYFYDRGFVPYQFLTGDAEIVDKSAFFHHYEHQLAGSILFQIPHHGSKYNWDDAFSVWQPFCYLWPVTHNANNKRKHGIGTFPSAVFKYIKENSVTEDPYSTLGVMIHFAK